MEKIERARLKMEQLKPGSSLPRIRKKTNLQCKFLSGTLYTSSLQQRNLGLSGALLLARAVRL
jgi:hypothetical protein